MTAATRGGPAELLRGGLLFAGTFALGLAGLALFLVMAGYPVGPAFDALWRGAFGSWYALTSATLVRAIPLMVLGLAFALAQRGGALNIGMEGQFAIGAMLATWAGVACGALPPVAAIPLVLGAGLAGGALGGVLPAWLRLRFGVTEVITTLLLNFVADAAVNYAITGPLQEPTHSYPRSAPIAVAAQLPRLLPASRLHLGLLIALLLAAALAVVFRYSAWGFRLRAVGEGPVAARIVGRIASGRYFAGALLLSAAIAGLGGAIEVAGVSWALYRPLSPGYGFTAIAVALMGRGQPGGIVTAALLFGGLEAGAGAMQREAGIPAAAVLVVQAIVMLTMVALRRSTR